MMPVSHSSCRSGAGVELWGETLVDIVNGFGPIRLRVESDVPEQGNGAAGFDRGQQFGIADFGGNPVKGIGREGKVERVRLDRILFEGRADNGGVGVRPTAFPSILRQSFAQLDAEQAIAPAGKRERGIAGSAANFEQAGIATQAGETDDILHEFIRVAGAGLVIQVRDFFEGNAAGAVDGHVFPSLKVTGSNVQTFKPVNLQLQCKCPFFLGQKCPSGSIG
jgi:hypothetical protein